MVPVLVPLVFTGELAYRLDYLLSIIGEVIPIFGRQFGLQLEHLAFSIAAPVVHLIGLVLLAIGTVSGNYVLYLFHTRDFFGMIPQRNTVCIYSCSLWA
nr:hypothetical protein [uncultured Desulfobulbus sp.]